MAVKFNVFTGNFDLTGSGGGGGASYIDGEVATYNDLPLDGTAALDSAWLVRSASGSWLTGRKPAGIYIRTATAGVSRDADYTYAGIFPDVFSDANFTLYDDTDTSKNLKFQLSGISANATRTLTAPNASGTIALTSDIPAAFNPAAPGAIGGTTPAAITGTTGSFTDLSASNKLSLPSAAAASPAAGDVYRVSNTLRYRDSTNAERLILNATDNLANLNSASTARTNLGVGSSDAVTFGSIQNTPIGSTTASTGAFTTLNANNGTITASAPVLDLSQTWNNAAVTFTGLQFVVTNTASNTASLVSRFAVGSSNVVETNVRGMTTFRRLGSSDLSNIAEFRLGSTLLANIRDDGAVNFSNNCTGAGCTMHNEQVRVGSGGAFAFTNASNNAFATIDVFLRRDAADTLAQRNGTAAQTFNVYGTFTSTTNYQRLAIKTKSVTVNTTSGASVVTTGGFIPDGAVLVGLTTRVSTAITGATGYDIGDGTDADRWGANIGVALATTSDNTNWTATTIQCFTAAQEVTLTAVGSNFTGGAVVIVAHYLAGEAD